ncbi:MAG TPA: hypothetical protein PLM06_05025 [Anaerolineae bacterium]|nr:hypothetical protein [Anaerolineae bacterium]
MISRRWLTWWLAAMLLAGCAGIPATPSPTVRITPVFPEVQLPGAPAQLCRDALQLRLEPLLKGSWPAGGSATWTLLGADAETPLAEGEWTPLQRDLLIAFPHGAPLAAGKYRVVLRAETQTLFTHTFEILAATPEVQAMRLLLTPDGPAVERLPEDTRVFYVQFRYAGVCPGAPLWFAVSAGADVVCTQALTLLEMEGEQSVACYREEGMPFAAGVYRAALTLTAPESRQLEFEVGAAPTPPPPPKPAVRCDAPFVAGALAPQGQPVLTADRFQWYTQAVYVGATCQELSAATPWSARWYREGTLLREFEGVWDGGPEGVIWDSLSGDVAAPFLRPGAYTVTLVVSATAPLTTTFRVIPYTPPTPTPEG